MKKTTSGFTVVELLIVIIVIGILVTITVTVYNGTQARTRDASRRVDIANLVKALEIYYDDNGKYPTASGTNSSVNSSWYSSDTTSWSTLQGALTSLTGTFPTDPKNVAGNITGVSSALNYAYFGNAGTYCGAGAGQMYIIVYRLEGSPPEKFTDGTCTTNELGSGYFTAGASYYRVIKGGS